MTREEVRALVLTEEQKARVESFYQTFDNFKWESCKDKFAECTTQNEVLAVIEYLQKAYDKRKEMEAKAAAKAMEARAKRDKLNKLIKDAEVLGYSLDSIIDIVTGMIKEAHNAKIQAEIEALKAKLI